MSKPTYCLHKLQEVLAEFLNIDVKSLPSIEDNLKAAGYIGIQKNDEIEYFSKGLEEFGTNYPQYYHKPQEAITHLLETKEGQVAGAFHKEGLGDIDLVWGKITDAENHKGYGLAHILDKRTAEFMQEGLSKEQAEIKAREFATQTMPKIVEKGSIVENAGVKTIILKEGDSEFRVGLSKGFYGKGDNEWIITSYERKNPNAQNFDQATNSKELENGNNLSLKDSKENSTTQSQTTYKNYDDAPTPANPHQSERNIDTSSVNRADDIKADSTTDSLKMQSNAHIGSGMLGGSALMIKAD